MIGILTNYLTADVPHFISNNINLLWILMIVSTIFLVIIGYNSNSESSESNSVIEPTISSNSIGNSNKKSVVAILGDVFTEEDKLLFKLNGIEL